MVHGGPFEIVETDGNPVQESARVLKDTVKVGPGEHYDVVWEAREPRQWLLLYAQIEGPLKVVLRRSFSTEGAVPKSFGGHLQILDTIEQADVKKACRILHKHDEDGMRRALAALPEHESTL